MVASYSAKNFDSKISSDLEVIRSFKAKKGFLEIDLWMCACFQSSDHDVTKTKQDEASKLCI